VGIVWLSAGGIKCCVCVCECGNCVVVNRGN
jgi:hypothetical protein